MKTFCLFLAGLVLPAQIIFAARPRIGLVLEGGGALGLAHIGVIRYLEEHHVPVDLVAGTSMGGLVGGLYAMGNSPAEIDALTDEIDWAAVLSGKTALQDLNFRRKEDRFAFPNSLELGIKHKKVVFPAGLNSGHQAGLVFDRATLAYGGLNSFDELPIPFRCVATDITSGREKVFSEGSLSQALRATMSIPGVFAPVIIDGHVYTDGGAINNLPVDVARKAGADIVIAVYLDPGPPDPTAYESPLTVASRNISIMVAANELHSLASADILLSADMHGVASFDFDQSAKIIPKGYEAAVNKQQMLGKLALEPAEWSAYVAARDAKIRRSSPVPAFLEVVGTRPNYTRALEESLTQYVGKPIDPPALEQSLTKIVGTGVMSSVGYSLVRRDGQQGLAVRAYEKSYGPPFLNLGFSINGASPNSVLFGMAARLTFLDWGGYRAEWRNDAFFGSIYGVSSEYYRPFTASSKWFAAPRIYAVSSPFNIYLEDQRAAQYRLERDGFGIDAGYAISSRAEFRVGEDLLWFKTKKVISVDPFPDSTTKQLVSSARFRYYGVDNVQLPRQGLIVESSGSWYYRKAKLGSFPQAQFTGTYFKPVSEPSSIFFRADSGTSFGTRSSKLDLQAFSLGGPLRLGAYGQNELLGNEYFLLQGGYEHKLMHFSPLIGEGLYGVTLFEIGKVYDNLETPATLALDGSVAVVARTALGPIFIGGSFGNNGHRRWWFGLGRIF